jgi:hypothetical protein
MADSFVQVFPDSTGKQIDTELIGAKHRQRVRIGGVGLADLATVTNDRLDVNIQSSEDAPVSVTNPGTSFDVSTDEGGDGTIALDGTQQILAEQAVGAGDTLYVTAMSFTADKKATFRLEVRDGGVLFTTKRVFTNTAELPGWVITLPVPIIVIGAASRTVRLTVTRTSGGGGISSGALNGYTI